jgi:hypothetical protein
MRRPAWNSALSSICDWMNSSECQEIRGLFFVENSAATFQHPGVRLSVFRCLYRQADSILVQPLREQTEPKNRSFPQPRSRKRSKS